MLSHYQFARSDDPGQSQFGVHPFRDGATRAGAAELVASARRSLDCDPLIARHYLDQLSAIIANEDRTAGDQIVLLPTALARGPGTSPVKGGLTAWQVRRVVQHVEQALCETIVVEKLAELARLSSGHFCRAFKVTMGETPHAFLIRQRVRRAQTLMLATNDTLSQIACACGLSDQAHLTRLFRRMVGDTPMAWRRTWQHAR